jgi:hypothetical protein
MKLWWKTTYHTPDVILATQELVLEPGEYQEIVFDFDVDIDEPQTIAQICLGFDIA